MGKALNLTLDFDILIGDRIVTNVYHNKDTNETKITSYDNRFNLVNESCTWEMICGFLRNLIPFEEGYTQSTAQRLSELGLKKYDVIDILKITKGELISNSLTININYCER